MKGYGKDFWVAALRVDGAALIGAVSEDDVVRREMPTCPDWIIGDLLRHLGSIYRRIRDNAASMGPDEDWGPLIEPEGTPSADDPAIVEWFREEFERLVAFLDALDPDRPTWNWAGQPRVARFWHRRMAHETAVHRWDAQAAVRLPEPIESKLAVDTVSEVLDTLLPCGFRKRRDVNGVVRLVATDEDHEWTVRLRGEGMALVDGTTLRDQDAQTEETFAAGTASDLALALWGRIGFDVFETGGDENLLQGLLVG